MAISRMQKIMVRRRFKLWASILGGMCIDPIRDKASFLQLLAFPFSLYFVFSVKGYLAAEQQMIDAVLAAKAVIWAIPIFIIWNAISAVFKIKGKESESGKIYGERFVYNKPYYIDTIFIQPEDNGKELFVKVKDAEPGSFVYFKLEYDKGLGYLSIANMYISGSLASKRLLEFGVRLNKKRQVRVQPFIPSNSIPTIVRIYALHWEL